MARKQQGLFRRVAGCDNLDSFSAKGTKFKQQLVQCTLAQFVAARMGNHSSATAVAYPIDRVAQGRPLMRRIPGFALDQIFFEHRSDVFGVTLLNQKTREVQPTYQVPLAGISASAFKAAVNAEFVELRRDGARLSVSRGASYTSL